MTGWVDEDGRTDYVVLTSIAEGGAGSSAPVTTQHRFSAFLELHSEISVELGLPTDFPVPKALFVNDTTKQERKRLQQKLQSASKEEKRMLKKQITAIQDEMEAKLARAEEKQRLLAMSEPSRVL